MENKLVNKWLPTGLLDDFDDVQRMQLAVLLENTAQELLREAKFVSSNFKDGEESIVSWLFPTVVNAYKYFLDNKPEGIKLQVASLPASMIFYKEGEKIDSYPTTCATLMLPGIDLQKMQDIAAAAPDLLEQACEHAGWIISETWLGKLQEHSKGRSVCLLVYIPVSVKNFSSRLSFINAKPGWSFLGL